METRWNAYAKVAANFAVNRVLIRMRLKTWLKEQDVFASGGGELAAAARLVYWAACDVSTCIDMHLLAEASRAVITPAIFWLQEKDGRRMLEFPEYLRIVLARPFIEHLMHNAILTVAGRDTGATLFGPADMQLSVILDPIALLPSPR